MAAAERDMDLELLRNKRLLELKRRLASEKGVKASLKDVVVSRLVDRGIDVLKEAERSYPAQAALIVGNLAWLIKKGVIEGYISGGELLHLFKSIGLDVRVETSVTVNERGRLTPFGDWLGRELKG